MTMLIYPKKQGRTNVPEWRKDKFLRLRGFIDAVQFLDELVRLKAYQVAVSSLLETRLYHHRSALSIRSDRVFQLDNLRSSLQLIDLELEEVNKKIASLDSN